MNVNRSLIVFEMILFAQLESIQFEKDCLFNLLYPQCMCTLRYSANDRVMLLLNTLCQSFNRIIGNHFV